MPCRLGIKLPATLAPNPRQHTVKNCVIEDFEKPLQKWCICATVAPLRAMAYLSELSCEHAPRTSCTEHPMGGPVNHKKNQVSPPFQAAVSATTNGKAQECPCRCRWTEPEAPPGQAASVDLRFVVREGARVATRSAYHRPHRPPPAPRRPRPPQTLAR